LREKNLFKKFKFEQKKVAERRSVALRLKKSTASANSPDKPFASFSVQQQ